ncbi:hypothetical protein CALVIDRAFT_387221 [Calocera viscosa TUFC12733]|uniref:Uncharacterized protein n=1 Tax=Calocera viscosa (strain TUFC12733) TaxID=1330018 RepID=A0A167GL05_CALVF|nr:hypothetical protein CALVIDRAFT_387221 [Calocera viscosa TUFC12733]
MPRLGDFEAYIEVDGVRLPEYRLERNESKRVVRCWIPSEVGKNFVVKWQDHSKRHALCGFVYLDGHCSHGIHLRPGTGKALQEGNHTTSTTLNSRK